MTTISSRHHPFVQRCREIARGRTGTDMLLDGEHLIGEALSAGLAIASAAIGPRGLEAPAVLQLRSRLERAGVPCLDVTEGVLDAASPVRAPSGIVAIASRPSWSVAQALTGPAPLAVVLAGVQDPGNVGAIIRAAEASSATGVVAAGATADPFGWKALRGSMGSAFRLPVAREPAWSEVRRHARERGLSLAGLVPRGGVSLYAADLTPPLLLVAGAEGAGVPPEVLADLDLRLSIPMPPSVESLNVAVAVGVTLFEAGRQRRSAP